MGMFNEPGPSSEPFYGGRKPTPRSVRIVSLQNSMAQADRDQHPRRESTDPSRMLAGAQARVWSRATSAGMSPTLLSSAQYPRLVRPRFRSSSLHPELLRNPSWRMRLWFFLFPIFVFLHIPLQTYFDFNAVFILLLVAKYPNPYAPGVPGSGRNWALGAAAYIACWVTQIFVVFVVYELIYSFVRRWRVKRPLMLPLYLSSPAFNLAAMTSYTNFCFLYHIRLSAFAQEHGNLRDGLAETFYYYSQNLPTVALLLPRAALSLALLLAFWSPQAGELALADAGISPRDGTFFRASDQTLTNYARGVLIANAAWTAWRVLVLFLSWIGVWVFSGQGCAGICGPRYRWEEDDVEKTVSAFADNLSDTDVLPWSWRECTLLRVVDAYEFCLTNKHPRTAGEKKECTPSDSRGGTAPYEGMDKVFAAIGLGGGPQPARRGVLSDDLFASPEPEEEPEEPSHQATVTLPAPAVQAREKHTSGPSGPLTKLPYPFVGHKAQVSSEDVVPFPPSPEPEEDREVPISDDVEGDEEEEEEQEGEEESEDAESEGRSEGRRTSGSMSSLGRPVSSSRYPFQFRKPPARDPLNPFKINPIPIHPALAIYTFYRESRVIGFTISTVVERS
ncbi:hypothetical protein EW026_g6508 [Hermanssonia centrifuga]|uniref:Uncharacterized protein n=1 Tax=Hermanssonia centrifuga TaxID=98765 RepID=A0A4S4KAU6_9APHY|nr:hypothetical protein EW026_g6508 [Hermanssonia centrifuga]